MDKRFPSAMRVYRMFMSGVKEFYGDLKEYVKIVRILNTSEGGFKSLTRKEIELYHQMPKDIVKVGPILLITALPFTNYIVFPLVYMFPKQLLSSHFWNLQQKSEYMIDGLKNRLLHHRPVFRHLQGHLDNMKSHELYKPWKIILGKLGSGVQPDTEDILKCRELFVDRPYNLKYLGRNHMVSVLFC